MGCSPRQARSAEEKGGSLSIVAQMFCSRNAKSECHNQSILRIGFAEPLQVQNDLAQLPDCNGLFWI